MLDVFEFRVPNGSMEYDPQLQAEVEGYDVAFSTRGRVKVEGLVGRDAEAGGRTVVTVTRELSIPVGSPAVPAGAYAVATKVHPTTDPTLLGARLRLTGPAPGSQTTARRLQVEEVLT